MNFSNSNLLNVSQGMMRIIESLEGLKKLEKQAAIVSVFNTLYNNQLNKTYSVSDVLGIADTMRTEAKRTKVPEFGGAERYVKGEL